MGVPRMTSRSTRRRFLEITAATAGLAGLESVKAASPSQLEKTSASRSGTRARPKIAAITTVYHYLSHAYHIVGRFIDGFMVHDGHGLHRPAFEIASLFIEQ